jgi:hypothetical protein
VHLFRLAALDGWQIGVLTDAMGKAVKWPYFPCSTG